ncbi:MAG: alcohol dehydrogenase catalytic domain-containing protein [Pseudonocardia sp.]|uniref:alcohol dehydrogenase catalytic domain-containing protein n=1 Tax=unclassified Pseudonocardia TaxID=2619320 RepID=UPI00086C036A|nr:MULTISPECIES: alcohol dehydrogenase catalytic domain-containing protein [unclassified Pseudonocardia]MBN9112162.1 alcohol dehydrogenase catalytic domain-containing protein [Pseudonocardia sp.]ODU30103.1 MAG: hypothetical protein ABS80_00405 [Pseudonocardia sp. SCN 72-51]ODV03027.1 MAG: hypothetical protein ABT15_23630 [Pseudonocardia sp. SCN 73-27]
MKAVTWRGVNEIGVEDVPEPTILNDHDVIVEVGLSATCGSDLHLMGGYIPAMRGGDVLGHEFMGRVGEVGPGVTKHQVGDRVVVVSFVGCGKCWYCREGLWSLCDNGNPNPGLTDALWGQGIGGCYGKFPLGAVMNKALTLRGAQQHGHRYIPEILDRMSRDEVKTEHLATHVMALDDGPEGYRMFKEKEDGCVRAVFRPGG